MRLQFVKIAAKDFAWNVSLTLEMELLAKENVKRKFKRLIK